MAMGAGLVRMVRTYWSRKSKMGDSKDGIGSNKEVDTVLSSILSKVNGMKSSLSGFVGKMEHEQLTWPSVLDSFSSLSGHTSNLMKQLGGDRLPPLHTRVILPLMVASDRDSELERQTEGRVPMMHHEVVPNYLRTKLGLELEGKQKERWELAEREGGPTIDKIKAFNQMLSDGMSRVNELRDEVEERRTKTEMVHSTLGETKKLVAAYFGGPMLPPLTTHRKAQLSGARHQMPSRNVVGRGAVRSDQRVAPYPAVSPHKQPR